MAARIRKTKKATVSISTATTAHTEAAPQASATSSSAPATPPSIPLVLLAMPPADANIPQPPSSFVPGDTADYRAMLPRDAELRALPAAVQDMAKFTNYTQILGNTAPPYTQMQQALIVANAWSSMRTESAAWDAFCNAQEGISWTMLRSQMAKLQPSFELAASGPENVSTLYPGLATLLVAKKVIARKGASTRKMNKDAVAKGETPVHGRVGKARQRKAEKAAYATASGAATTGAGATTVAQSAAPAPNGAGPATSASGLAAPTTSAPSAGSAPVSAAASTAAPTNGAAANGTGH